MGTPFEIDASGKILFLEEVGEAPYRVDRMLRQLLLSGKLNDASAIIFGECVACEESEGKPSLTLEEVLREVAHEADRPCFYGFPGGHGKRMWSLPLGAMGEMDADLGLLTIDEPVVEVGIL